MNTYESSRPAVNSLVGKLLYLAVVAVFVMVGVVGLILPIIPGLLFLALAAIAAARISPAVERLVRRNPTLAGCLDSSYGFLNLNWVDKLKYCFWIAVKVIVESTVYLIMLVVRFLRWTLQRS